ncbi:MAG: transposase, partial [Gemmatimonadota bacterium]
VVETCPFWPWIHDVIGEEPEVGFHLAHASRLEAIAASNHKTDAVDAELMARMLSAGLVPEVYPKPPEQRELCRLVRHRRTLVEERTSLYNRIHSYLLQRGLQVSRGRLKAGPGRRWLEQEAWSQLRPEQRALIDERIRDEAEEQPAARLLQTIPGIGPYRSLLLVAEITPIERFPSPDELVAFAGLAPTSSNSGVGEVRYGPIPEGANRQVRGALVSAI